MKILPKFCPVPARPGPARKQGPRPGPARHRPQIYTFLKLIFISRFFLKGPGKGQSGEKGKSARFLRVMEKANWPEGPASCFLNFL